MTDWASREAVEEAAQAWADAIVHCRAYGHAWMPFTVDLYRGVYTITQVCRRTGNIRCGCTRSRQQTVRGYYERWNPRYPKGYLLVGQGRIDAEGRAALAVAALRHLTINEVTDEEDE